ncbi:MAG TPA: T9SS type A sorting domain-containing protein, partial [Saprospiraceae bacterium]|nr:T9SS type A sorting domain-containing protein [Saprospiraceae bacterium]
QSWFDNNPQWVNHITYGWKGPGAEYAGVQNDTFLGGQPAKILNRFFDFESSTDFTDVRVARQNGDTIWCWNHIANQFYIHYNFSLAVGDSVKVPIYWGGTGKFRYVIDSIGTISINNQTLRFQRVSISADYDYLLCDGLIIEQIGMTNGQCVNTLGNYTIPKGGHFFLDEPNSGASDGPEWTFCRFKNDQFMYQFSGLPCNGLVAAPETTAASSPAVVPNPFQDDFSVTLPPGEKIASLRLFDIAGKTVFQVSNPAETKIHAGDLPPGVYFLEIVTSDQKRYFSKLAH